NGGTATTTFYTGGVVFANSSQLTQSASTGNFFWDETNKRLGLGVSSPKTTLHVVGGGTSAIDSSVPVAITTAVGSAGQLTQLGFGYNDGTQTNFPAVIGGVVENSTSNTSTGLFFATRALTTDTAALERM